ncbi:uncharacterized protein DUF1987 [Paenibacillus taihuensis]|uniref:Uncharacterized protein DUF1987 n=1 Tax=Paenibacillus taihuensis TaxID=1156355 RepID=A0A3D9SKX3_9BACL|nr:DUF1987 domain-containing protein [Paenibacillus taihuensis]REE90642.1 uncharacterized protein DUF1987 [Paenibacillus taihuensis]
MNPLYVESTKSTPEVRFDPAGGTLVITGQSYPENAFRFYEPLMNWLDDYLEHMKQSTVVTIELHLPYVNTSSTKCLMHLLEKLDKAFASGKKVEVRWYCDEENEAEQECAEEFKEDLQLPFAILPRGTGA